MKVPGPSYFLASCLLISSCAWAQQDTRPNILLLIADDLGYADLGSFGSSIRTPNLDALAEQGTIFTNFHTSPMCAPTRAMLLSGNNNHVAGMGRQGGGPNPTIRVNLPGYESHLSDRIAPMPLLLADVGYQTYMTGKWHLGNTPETSPTAAGFQRVYSMLHGAAAHFSDKGLGPNGSQYWKDGEPSTFPDGAYTTELFTDELIQFIDDGKDNEEPFFAMAAYTSPHWPLQVPDDYLDLYAGEYDQGYDQLRIDNMETLKRASIISPDHVLPPRNDAITPWEQLTAEEQRKESRKMELYASMVENLDFHVGRILDYLRDEGMYENTLIIFMSDNGAAAEDFYYTGSFVDYISTTYSDAYEDMGKPGSWISYGQQWAEAGSAPFSRRKTYTAEGGIVAPMIIAGAGMNLSEPISNEYITVMDFAPTFLEIAGATYPDDGSVEAMRGESLLPFLEGRSPEVHDDEYVVTVFHGGRAYIRQGPWKLMNLEPPFSESQFQLFNVEQDPGETENLRDSMPEKYEELIALWRTERMELGIVLPQDL